MSEAMYVNTRWCERSANTRSFIHDPSPPPRSFSHLCLDRVPEDIRLSLVHDLRLEDAVERRLQGNDRKTKTGEMISESSSDKVL
eukprot:9472997-Pyramimonas_sp.AAC.1